jgi:hypothetical protein
MENNHPIQRGSFYVIHNGHVWNDSKLFKGTGKRRVGAVDSEVFAAMLARRGNLNHLPEIMAEIEGAAAVGAVDSRNPNELSLARGYDSPLYVLETRKMVVFGSTRHTVLATYRRHVGSMDGERVKEIDEGVALHWKNLTRTESAFKAYIAPPRAVPLTHSWSQSTSGLALPPVTIAHSQHSAKNGWEDDDYLDCDECGTWSQWQDVTYKEDPETGLTINLCFDCAAHWERGNRNPLFERDPYTPSLKEQPLEEWREANEHILRGI